MRWMAKLADALRRFFVKHCLKEPNQAEPWKPSAKVIVGMSGELAARPGIKPVPCMAANVIRYGDAEIGVDRLLVPGERSAEFIKMFDNVLKPGTLLVEDDANTHLHLKCCIMTQIGLTVADRNHSFVVLHDVWFKAAEISRVDLPLVLSRPVPGDVPV